MSTLRISSDPIAQSSLPRNAKEVCRPRARPPSVVVAEHQPDPGVCFTKLAFGRDMRERNSRLATHSETGRGRDLSHALCKAPAIRVGRLERRQQRVEKRTSKRDTRTRTWQRVWRQRGTQNNKKQRKDLVKYQKRRMSGSQASSIGSATASYAVFEQHCRHRMSLTPCDLRTRGSAQ